MMTRSALILLMTAMAVPGAAGDFAIDPTHSSVGFKVDHMVVAKVRGTFGTFEGAIHLDREDMTRSSVDVTIDVASIDTGDEKRDEHLRSPDFFAAAENPQITFKSTSVSPRGSGYIATGELTIRGTTHPVDLSFVVNGPITDPWGNERIGVQVDPLTIDRREYGLTWSQALETGGLLVGNDVEIELEVEAVRAEPSSGS